MPKKRNVTSQRSRTSAGRSQAEVKRSLSGEPAAHYSLRLYVAGTNQNSSLAIENVMRLRDSELRDRCEVQIVDMYQQPELAARDGVIAAPTLVKLDPPPRVTFIGNLSDSARVLAGLGIRPNILNVRNAKKQTQQGPG